MQYAINIGDMTRDAFICGLLVTPVSSNRSIVKAEKTLDGGALLLECDDTRAQGIIGVIRTKYQKHQIRAYKSKTGKGGWKRI